MSRTRKNESRGRVQGEDRVAAIRSGKTLSVLVEQFDVVSRRLVYKVIDYHGGFRHAVAIAGSLTARFSSKPARLFFPGNM